MRFGLVFQIRCDKLPFNLVVLVFFYCIAAIPMASHSSFAGP